jgi:hypothetical protein
MGDLLHMLVIIVAGMVIAVLAAAYVGVLAMLVVIGAAGWAAAQYDHNYKDDG